MLLLSSAVLFTLFFSGDDLPAQKETWRSKYLQKDSLGLYLEKLFELTDDHAFYFSNKADSLLKTLWRQPINEREQTAYLDFILNIAYHLLQQGQIPASTHWYEAGLNYQQQSKLTSYETEEFILKPLGNNYLRLGDYDKAVAIQQMAIEHAEKQNKQKLLSSLYSNLAITFFGLKKYDEVQINCNKGLQYISFNTVTTGLLYNVKADAFYEAGIKDSASFYNQKALQFFRSPESVEADAGWIVSTLGLSAKLLADKKQFGQAVIKLQNAEQILQQIYPETRQRDKAKLFVEKGNLFLQLKNTDSSLSNFKQGLQYFQFSSNAFYPDNTVTALYFGLAGSLKLQHTDSSLYYYQLAMENDYYTNQLVSTSVNSLQNNAVIDEGMNHEAIHSFYLQYQLTGKQEYLQKQVWLMELSKGRKLLNEVNRTKQWATDSSMQQAEQLFRELRYDYLLLAETKDSTRKTQIEQRIRQQELALGLEENRFAQLLKEPSFALFKQKLNEVTASTSLLSYYVADDSLYCLMAGNKDLKVTVLNSVDVNTKLTQLINTYLKDGSTAFTNDPKSYFQSAFELYQLVLPFNLQRKQLIISPDGLLHQLPFEALSTDSREIFLGGEKQISYLYSFLQYVNEEKTDHTALPLTVYSFSKQHLGFAALPNSSTEEKYLNSHFSSTTSDAVQTTEEMFVQSMQSKSVLHIATHAVAGDSINQPFLVLKKKFYLGQLQYSIAASPLVVLTACETAAGQLQTGEGVVSLGRAFISKGVKGVVASRWKVDDAVAPVFVKAFYAEMKETHSPAAALLEARRKYLQTATNLSQKNPLLWSGFSYMGVEQQIELKKAGSFNWYWLLLLLIVPVVFIIKRKPLFRR